MTSQLADYVAALARCCDAGSAIATGVAGAVTAVGADAGALLDTDRAGPANAGALLDNDGAAPADADVPDRRDDEPHSAGAASPPGIGTLPPAVVAVARAHAGVEPRRVDGPVAGAVAALEGLGSLAVARTAGRFTDRELELLQGLGAVLAQRVAALRALEVHDERDRLLRRLTRIQRSISHRAPLQEVLDAITRGAQELLGDSVVGLRLLDPQDPGCLVLASAHGISPQIHEVLRRGPVGEGAGGRAIAEDRLVVIEQYHRSPEGLAAFRGDHLQTAMAAPVRSEGKVVGSLTVGSYTPGRRYSADERQALLALADHASVALTDAGTVASLREAQATKDLFLAMVSHELKTPLTVIMGTLRTLERHAEALRPGQQRDMLQTAYRRGRDLERLIDGLLVGARAELVSGPPETCDLHVLVADAVSGFEHLRRVEVGDVPAVSVRVDAAAVRAVLGSLLENAVAHAPESTPIRLDAEADAVDVTLTVSNDGALPTDLSPEDLFRAFRRGADARSPGVGLGLHIASRLAEGLSGSITGASAGGTVSFRLRFPREPAAQR